MTETSKIAQRERLWVVVPAYNEGSVINEVVGSILSRNRHVVVVDDCSKDETGKAALDAGAVVVRHPINLGQGAALQTGISYALSRDAEYVVTFDADGQHRVEDIDVLFEVQRSTNADAVVGSRFLGAAENLPPARKAVLKAAVVFTRLTSGVNLTDAHNGLRLLTKDAAKKIQITQNRMAHASEITDQLARLGLSIAEAPVTILYTAYSLQKGQKLSNAFNILAELLVGRLTK